ncbi:AI-2E family transporter [Candidatus Parcubacteria bacterium]|jgi:predicted PurR-regulated permease PerM|nr:MAG: AI-2E family transporter [Candidatus Parcubacteria bacterium]
MAENPGNPSLNISTSTMLRLILVVIVLAFAYTIREVFVLFIVALVLATALDPWVDKMQARKIPRSLGVVLLYILLFGTIALILAIIIPPLINQINELSSNFPSLYQKFIDEFTALRDLTTQAGLQNNVNSFLQSLQLSIGKAGSSVFGAITSFFGGLISFLAILIMTYYMLSEESGMKRFFSAIVPLKYQPFLNHLFSKIQFKMGGWLRGQLFLMLIVAVADFIGLSIIGVKYALALALFAGLLEIVPLIGSTIAAIPAVFVAFTLSPTKGILTILLFFVVQQIENNLIVPKVMKSTTGLHSVVVIVVLLIGAKLAGILGVLLAIPVTLILSAIYSEIWGQRREEEMRLEQ